MLRRTHKEGIEMLTIHDAFYSHPLHMNRVRYHYKELLAEIAESNMMQDILRDVTGDPKLIFNKLSDDLADDIRDSEYCLS